MKWSWKIARIAGIDINIHATFLLLVAWIAYSYWASQGSLIAVTEGVLFLLALFACVVLHEFGHALAARRYGIPTRDITLLPIGGVARLERMPEKPSQELIVASAGPLVNLAISALLFAGLALTGSLVPLTQLSLTNGSFAERLLAVNVSLFLFNIIPAFPMDGGRIFRALLATRLPYARATQIAATLGQGLAFLLGFIGLFGNPVLLFIALFVWIGATQEASTAQVKSMLNHIPVRSAMLTEFHTLSPTDNLARATELTLSGSQRDFPVTSDDHLVGLLTREGLIRGLSENDDRLLVSYAMEKKVETVDASSMLGEIMERIQGGSQNTFPVLQNQSLVGLINLENIGEYLMIDAARHSRRGSLPRAAN